MLEDGILVAEQSLTRQPKGSRFMQHSPLAFTGAVKEVRSDQSAGYVKA